MAKFGIGSQTMARARAPRRGRRFGVALLGTLVVTSSGFVLPAAADPGGTVPIEFTADSPAAIVVGDATPTIGFTVSGDDGTSYTDPTCGVVDPIDASGTYITRCTGIVDDGYYVYSYVDGSLEVQRAAVTVTASSENAPSGGPVSPVTASYAGDVPGIPTDPTITCDSEPVAGDGVYVTSCTGPAQDDHYDYTYVDGTLIVGDVPVTITADSPTIALGQPLPGPGIVNTFAGDLTGAAGYDGDGGPAVGALLDGPASTAVDKAGNVYIADAANNVVRKVATDGKISTFAGPGVCGCSIGDGGQAVDAYIDEPSGVAVDGFGNVYIAEYYENRVRKVAPDGVITTVAGTGNPGYSGDGGLATLAEIDGPTGLAVTAGGTLYIADFDNNVVRRVSSTGIISTFAGNGSYGAGGDGFDAVDASLDGPVAVAVAPGGTVYIADSYNNKIRAVDTGGLISTFAGTGSYGTFGDGGNAVDADLADPESVATDTWGNVFIGEYGGNVVRQVALDGTISTFAGCGCYGYDGDGGPAIEATFDGIVGVAVDAVGGVYISDLYNNVVRRVTYGTLGHTVAGDVPGVPVDPAIDCTVVGGVTGPGTYPTTCSATDAPPYTYTIVDGVLTVTKATVHVYASSAVFSTSATPPAVAFATVGDVDGYPIAAFSCDVAPIAGVGSYATSCTGPASDTNYDYVYVDGEYRVTHPAVVITADSPSINELDPPPTIGFTVSGDVGVDPVDPSIACDVEPLAGPGIYTTTCTGPASDANYDYTYVDGELIVRANVSIVPDDMSTTFGTPIDQSLASRFAGTTNCDGEGDGGPAVLADVCAPSGLATDSAGNVYIAEAGSNSVRRVAPDGTITTIAGTGVCGYTDGVLATVAELCLPVAVALDSLGNIYISDLGNNVVRKIEQSSGLISTFAGTGTCGTVVDASPAISVDLCDPEGLVVLPGDALLIASGDDNIVYAVDPGGTIHRAVGTGTCGTAGDGGPAGDAELCGPVGLAFDPNEPAVYIADVYNNAIRKVDTSGNLTTPVNNSFNCGYGGNGGPAVDAQLCGAYSVAVDGEGNLYIGEASSGTIRKVDSAGDIDAFAGGGCGCGFGDGRPALEASFFVPFAVAADANGHLYIADVAANTVRLVTTTSSPVPGGPVPGAYLTTGDYGPQITQPVCASDAPYGIGTFPITCSGPASDTYYDYTYGVGTLTVDPAPLTVTASSGTIYVGGSYTVTPTISGELEGYTVGPLVCSVVGPITGPGTYPTRCERDPEVFSEDPYDITFIDGTLTVVAESISGTVTRQETGDPLGGIQVTVYNSSGVVAATTTTDVDGTYHVPFVPAGKYKVRFVDPTAAVPTEYWDNKFTFGTANQVTVATGVTSAGIDVAMGLASLSGTVTDGADGQPLKGYQVALINSSGVTVQTTATASDGTYSFIGVAAGSYKLRYTDPLGVRPPELYHGQFAYGTATPVVVGSGSTVTGIDEEIRFTTITGTVRGSSGELLEGVSVSIITSTGTVLRTVTTGADGRYSAGFLFAGSYRLRFVDSVGGRPTVFWTSSPNLAGATPVTITNATVDNIDVVMVAAISGRVTDFTTGLGISGVQVTAYNSSGVAVATVPTDGSGNYTVVVPNIGNYRVRFVDPGGRPTRYWAASPTFVGASPISVNPAATGIDIVMGFSSITGTVTAQAGGLGLSGILVTVYNSSGVVVGTTTTDANGHYSVGGLRAGSHKVRFSDPTMAHPTRFYNGATTFATANAVAVGDVQIVAGINIALP